MVTQPAVSSRPPSSWPRAPIVVLCFVATNELPLQATVLLHLDNSSPSSLFSTTGSLVVTDHLFSMLSSTVVSVLIVGIKSRRRVSSAPPGQALFVFINGDISSFCKTVSFSFLVLSFWPQTFEFADETHELTPNFLNLQNRPLDL